MRKLSFHGLKYAFLGAAFLILGSCVAPVDTTEFLEDEEVGKTVQGGKGFSTEPDTDYEHPKDGSPQISVGGTAATIANGTVTGLVDLSSTPVVITVTNADDVFGSTSGISYDSIAWYYDGTELTADLSSTGAVSGINDIFTATKSNAPFNGAKGTYPITVVGTATTTETSELTGTPTPVSKNYTTLILLRLSIDDNT